MNSVEVIEDTITDMKRMIEEVKAMPVTRQNIAYIEYYKNILTDLEQKRDILLGVLVARGKVYIVEAIVSCQSEYTHFSSEETANAYMKSLTDKDLVAKIAIQPLYW